MKVLQKVNVASDMPVAYNIICFGLMQWGNMWKQNKSMMAEMAKCDFINKVIFVNPLSSIRTLFRKNNNLNTTSNITSKLFPSKIELFPPSEGLNNNNLFTTKRRKTMCYKKGVIGFVIVLSICALIGSSPLIRAESTEQRYDVDACVSMDLSPLVRSQEITIFNFDAKGIMRSNTESKVLDNCTVHVKGVGVFEGKKHTVYAYMKYLDPDGDYVIFRYTQNPGEKTATTTIMAATGK